MCYEEKPSHKADFWLGKQIGPVKKPLRLAFAHLSGLLCQQLPNDVVCVLQKRASNCFVELLLACARALGPVIRRFISLGLNRVWLDAGNAAYRCSLPLSLPLMGWLTAPPWTLILPVCLLRLGERSIAW